MCVNEVQCCGFQSRERHVQRISAEFCVRHRIFGFIAALCRFVQRCASWIWHANHACNLVKALPCRVITRCTQNAEFCVILHVNNQRMPARNDKAQKRRLQIGVRQIISRNVPADMVNRNKRYTETVRCCLCKIHANQYRADQPRRIGHSDCVDFLPRHGRARERLICQRINRFDVLARSQLRHDAAIETVQCDLRGNAICQNCSSVLYNSDGGFVAGGFHGENSHFSSFLRMRASSLGCW